MLTCTGDIYKTIFFVKAETRVELTSDFAAMARALNLPVKDEKNQDVNITAVKHWLESNAGWLLTFDNADDLAMARTYFPSNKQGHILLTTRSSSTGGIAQCVEIDKMQPQEAAYFLLRRAGLLVDDSPLEAAEPEEPRCCARHRLGS